MPLNDPNAMGPDVEVMPPTDSGSASAMLKPSGADPDTLEEIKLSVVSATLPLADVAVRLKAVIAPPA